MIQEAIGMQECEDETLALLVAVALQRQLILFQGADVGDFLFLQRRKREREVVFVRNIAELAGAEVLALLEADLEPGVVVLELPLPRHLFGPEFLLLFLERSDRRTGGVPGADEIAERLQGFARRLRLVSLIGAQRGGQSQKHSKSKDARQHVWTSNGGIGQRI